MKLKRLICTGFKSFADRTEFEFDGGISCIVGPNGCGKSNVVDAVKWVMGEQSAKSLRGSEMLDVIFNGSQARRAAGRAEVTLVFDNADGLLQPSARGKEVAAAEVAVTRRLYRSGQSDYFINKTPARLKDIREMLMDTGIGHDAYSVIEQGRIEAFLQSSHDERRAIFDEAAGISKYKARKKEALRKLERVEQNLLRLGDILGEVEKRLRSIKHQAGKARSYQRLSERLQELRSLHFLAQYHELSQRRGSLQGRLDAGSDKLAAIQAHISQLEASRSATEVELVDLEQTSRQIQGQIAAVSGQITTCQERQDMFTRRVDELGEQVVLAAKRCEEMEARLEECSRLLTERRAEADEAQAEAASQAERFEADQEAHSQAELEITHLQARLEDEKAGAIDLLRRTSQLHNDVHASRIRRENLRAQEQHLLGRAEEIDASLASVLAEHGEATAKMADVREVIEESTQRLADARQKARDLVDSEQQLQHELAELREQRSGVLSRMGALAEMQRRLEGVSAGVRRVLEARQAGRLGPIRGMLAEFLHADVRHAPLVEAALAGADQRLVVDRFDQAEALRAELREVLGDGGTVELLCLDRVQPATLDFCADACPHVTGRMIDYVRVDAGLAPAAWAILGRTLAVATLADAAAAAAVCPRGWRFVTANGDVLEPDGRVRVGGANRGAGIITRRSELVELDARRAELDERIESLHRRLTLARSEIEHAQQLEKQFRTAIYEANIEGAECKSRLAQLGQQIEALQQEKPVVAADLADLADRIDAAARAEHEANEKAAELERIGVERQHQIERLTGQIESARDGQRVLADRMTEAKVARAEAEQRRRALRDALAALTRQHDEMSVHLTTERAEIQRCRQRRQEAEGAIEAARQETDRLFGRLEELNAESRESEESRRGLNAKLSEIRQRLSEDRKAHAEGTEQVNALRVELGEVDVRVENLIARAGDEMGMNLLDLYRSYAHDEGRDWQAMVEEIKDLTEKVRRLGNVNLDAIAEQDDLEKRQAFLDEQLRDVRASEGQLRELIRRLNRECRDRFTETFEQVRRNFHELFRKLFGGGRADIILLDPDDVLESGIEIFARPPGKELRSLSLLSGGEKTMTALALLFSIFKCRPSPFSLLDEVDAALDETNTERFCQILQEFVGLSQFIVISHAKRTMSMANVLYGVTMQEPGVSKRISVRFEDVGHKLDQQLQPVGAPAG